LEQVRGEGVQDPVGGGLGGGMVDVAHQQRQRVFAESGGERVLALRRGGQARRGGRQQVVGRIQADVRQQALEVVGLHQQQAVLAAALGGGVHRVLERAQEGGAVVQAGRLVAAAQLLDLLRQLGVHFLAADH